MTDTTLKGKPVRIKEGAYDELQRRNWHKGVPNQDGKLGTIAFVWGEGTADHHIAVTVDDETNGYPPECVEMLAYGELRH